MSPFRVPLSRAQAPVDAVPHNLVDNPVPLWTTFGLRDGVHKSSPCSSEFSTPASPARHATRRRPMPVIHRIHSRDDEGELIDIPSFEVTKLHICGETSGRVDMIARRELARHQENQ